MASTRSPVEETEAKKFRDSVSRLKKYIFKDDENSKITLSLLLDELVAAESSNCYFEYESEGSELLAHLAIIIPLQYERIVAKFCQVISNFCTEKNVLIPKSDLEPVVLFLTKALQQCQSFVHTEILNALCVVCENNTHNIEKFHDILVGGKGLLLKLTDDTTCEEEVVVDAVKCLANLVTIRPNYAERIEVRYLSASFDTLIHLLHRAPNMKMGFHMRNKLLMHCFNGIQNIIILKRLPNIELGMLLAAVRAYMFYGLISSQTVNIPTQLYPNVVTPYDPLASNKTPKQTVNKKTRLDSNEETTRGRARDGGAATSDKTKKPRKKKGKSKEENDSGVENKKKSAEKLDSLSYNKAWSSVTPESEAISWEMTWLKLSSSESEFSDTEGGRARQNKSEAVRVRQSALSCFLNIVRVIDKKVMFGYWSSFIPDTSLSINSPQMQSLFTTILKDPAPKCRMAAVASLTAMLESTRPYLAAAEEISTHQSAFTPFSAILGSMIREMHRCLLQALVAENFKAVLTQIIKCLANLVNNVPYHRLNPGLLTRVLKQIRHFFNHKDPNVRTACLTCIGAIVGIKPPLMEVSQLIKPHHPPVGVNRSANPSDSPLFRPEDASYLLYPSFAPPQISEIPENTEPICNMGKTSPKFTENDNVRTSDTVSIECEDACLTVKEDDSKSNVEGSKYVFESVKPVEVVHAIEAPVESHSKVLSTELSTPVLGASCGTETPVYTDQMLQAHARDTSWVIKFCVKNITGQPDLIKEENQSKLEALQKFEPLPIRLEALQVMSNLIKNYFPIIRQSCRLLQNLVEVCLGDSNHIIVLHGTKVLDELTQALQRDIQDHQAAPQNAISFQQVLDFWLFLLEGPLPHLLEFNPGMSEEGNNLVRSGACECMANVGEEVFAKLPRHRQIQCVTLVLGLAADDDKLIKASAVRALGIYVMYSCLKDDVAFLMDAGTAILSCMKSTSNSVRFKAAWAMANLCDTLVSNKENGLEEILAEFKESMVLELVECAASATKDSDKISCNAARAIGNLLRFLPSHLFQKPEMEAALLCAVRGLVKNMSSGTMKVRWNSCYAASNAFQNAQLPIEKPWVSDILNTLSKVVQNSLNFKVRINAALGLSAPQNRQAYGSRETFCNAWISLVNALESAENINDFAEYKYKNSLTEHLCGAVLRLTSVILLSDLSSLAQSVQLKGHSFRTYMEKYLLLNIKKAHSNIPSVETVKAHLERLHFEATSDEQRRCLQGLLQACVPDSDSLEDKRAQKSSFQQIYD
ncbi:HEAT repeat-containing protein 6-like isoform X2 [Physella acuta]|uniref:HEAT repeat-containing protein 6-like isoform X2 n=1 Tax=Physella acuta TaxID=109671 RepID=UPI0027DCE335|nr:HEAT repeat-containing protein 6-like isoform X2 [Physella acuta]